MKSLPIRPTTLPTSCPSLFGLEAYFIKSVEDQNRFFARPCLLHPVVLVKSGTAGLNNDRHAIERIRCLSMRGFENFGITLVL